MKKFLSLIIAIIIIFGFYLGYEIIAPNIQQQQIIVTIKKGESVAAIAKDLKGRELIGSELAFKIMAKLSGQDYKLVAGEHLIKPQSTINDILNSLASPVTLSNENKITLIEGWDNNDVADYLSGQGIVTTNDFNSAAELSDWQGEYSFLRGGKAKTLEGFIFPDTYRIFKNAPARDIIKKTLDNFDQKLTPDMRQAISRQGRTIFQIVTLASIVEKEARTPADMKMVADIFWKRIAAGMGLQSGATVNFITGKKDTRPATADLSIDSPYNTYKYRGLPPGPICNPGLEAIKAAIYPQSNDYYYFLYGKDGKIYFARTYDEHLKNKQLHLN